MTASRGEWYVEVPGWTGNRTRSMKDAQEACGHLEVFLTRLREVGAIRELPALGVDLAEDGSYAVRANVHVAADVALIPRSMHGIAVVVKQREMPRAFDASAEVGAGGVNPCPICGADANWRCRCFLTDSKCAYGHEWHYSKDECFGPRKKPYWRRAVHQGPSNHGQGPCCENPVVLHPVTPLVDCVARGQAVANWAAFVEGIIDRLSARLLGKAGIIGVSDNLADGKLLIEVLTTDPEATQALLPQNCRVIGGIPILVKESGEVVAYED